MIEMHMVVVKQLISDLTFRIDDVETMNRRPAMVQNLSFLMSLCVTRNGYSLVHITPQVYTTPIWLKVWQNVFRQTQGAYRSTFVIGDINIDILKAPKQFKDFMQIYGLENVIIGPTCFKAKMQRS